MHAEGWYWKKYLLHFWSGGMVTAGNDWHPIDTSNYEKVLLGHTWKIVPKLVSVNPPGKGMLFDREIAFDFLD